MSNRNSDNRSFRRFLLLTQMWNTQFEKLWQTRAKEIARKFYVGNSLLEMNNNKMCSISLRSAHVQLEIVRKQSSNFSSWLFSSLCCIMFLYGFVRFDSIGVEVFSFIELKTRLFFVEKKFNRCCSLFAFFLNCSCSFSQSNFFFALEEMRRCALFSMKNSL